MPPSLCDAKGFGKDAVALPVDELAGSLTEGLPVAVARVDTLPDAETGEIIRPCWPS